MSVRLRTKCPRFESPCNHLKSWLLLIFLICLHNQLKFHNSRTLWILRFSGNHGTPGPQETRDPRGSPGRLRSVVFPWSVWAPGSLIAVSSLQQKFHFKGFHINFKVNKFWFKFHVLRRYGRKELTTPNYSGTLRTMEL